jgi:hypothetical protein
MAWYFKNGDQISGPFEEGVVHSGLKSGFIDPKTTLFRMAENKPWTPIDQTPFKIGGKPPIAPPISAASTNSPIPSPAWGDQPRNLSPLPPPTSKERPNDARLVLGILLPFIFALIGAVVVNILDTSFNGLVYISLLLGCFLSFHLLKKFGAIAIVIGLLALSVWVSNEAPVKLRLPIMLSVVLGVSSYFIVKFKFITMNSLVIAFSTFAISMLISTPVVYYTLSIKDSDAIEFVKEAWPSKGVLTYNVTVVRKYKNGCIVELEHTNQSSSPFNFVLFALLKVDNSAPFSSHGFARTYNRLMLEQKPSESRIDEFAKSAGLN